MHEANIDRLAAAGIVSGTGPGTFAPNATVTRAQVASILARTVDFVGAPLPAGPDAFADDDLSPHRTNIDAVAAAGIATGTGSGAFSRRRATSPAPRWPSSSPAWPTSSSTAARRGRRHWVASAASSRNSAVSVVGASRR